MKLTFDFTSKNMMGMNYAVALDKDVNKPVNVLKLNDTANRILQLLQEGKQEEEIISCMMSEYDIEEAELRNNVSAFLDQLEKEGLLER